MIIDLHCDTASKLYEDKEACLHNNDFHVDVKKLIRGNVAAQFFAFFIPRRGLPKGMSPFDYYSAMYNHFQLCLQAQDTIEVAKSYEEYKSCHNRGKIAAILTIEGGDAIEGDLSKLQRAYDQGIRLMTLTWNYPNEIGFPNITESYMREGLTPFGIELIEHMNSMGMLIDVSHLSDAGFWDVARMSNRPLIATHSNARSIQNNRRNLSDEMIKTVAESGGIMGINFFGPFLDVSHMSTVHGMIKHIKHIYHQGGIEVLALGTDFDGITCQLEIENIGEMDKLISGLRKEGFTSRQIDKITFGNAERMLKLL